MSIDLPRRIKSGPLWFSVRRCKIIDGDPRHLGECNYTKATIKIKAGLPVQRQAVTLMHEATHSLLRSCGRSDLADDESLVERLSEGLMDTLWNSPGLLRYLRETNKQ